MNAEAGRYVTDELVEKYLRGFERKQAAGWRAGVWAGLEAVAGDIAAARTREIAAELTAWLDRQDGIGDYWMGELREVIGRWEP